MSESLTRKELTYRQAGVDIDAGDALVDNIVPYVKKTWRPEVSSHLGGYAGLFALDLKKYPAPLIVSTTDGVGTKLKLAFELKKFDTIGQDLVAMCVNDLICCGAEPLFFLDYFATGGLDIGVAQTVIAGIASALSEINCTLIGGETAEMPGFYARGEFDLAGFAVGVVNRDKVVDGRNITEGDALIGLYSSGVHSNGYSLVRKVIEEADLKLTDKPKDFPLSLGETLLVPTQVYVNPVLRLIEKFGTDKIKGLAHITGGGLVENVPRILTDSISAHFHKKAIPTPPLFRFLQEQGNVPEAEMWRVFNMGIGMVLAVPEENKDEILAWLKTSGYPAGAIGAITKRQETAVVFS